MSAAYTCLDCGKGFRDASALESHSKSKKHALARKPFSSLHGMKTRSYDQAGWYKVDMPYGRTMVLLPASKAAVASATASNDAAAAGAARATFGTARATAYPPVDPTMECRCVICDLSFRSDKELNAHYMWSPTHPPCVKCAKCFQDKTELSRHLQAAHACDICVCGVIFEPNHASAHYKDSLCHPKCIHCGAAFKDAHTLDVHHKSSHYDHCCVRCNLWYPTKPDLQRHYFECVAHPRCIQCKEGFAGHVEYFQHVAAVYKTKGPTIIPATKFVAVSQPPQKSQQKKPVKYRCDHCNIDFTKSKQLKKHNRKTPLHPCCTQCNKAYATYGAYESHMINKHPQAELLPKLPPRMSPQAVQIGPSTNVQQSVAPGPGSQTAGLDVSASNCATATAVPEVVDGGYQLVELSVKPQVLVDVQARETESIASVDHVLPAADNAGPSSETGQDAGMMTQTTSEQEQSAKTPEVDLESDTGSVISVNSFSSTNSEVDALVAQAQALPHSLNMAVQCEDADEREEEASSDTYEYIHADERSTDVDARAIYERPDSVISYVTETDLDSAVLSASSSARPLDSTATQASSSSNAARDMDAEQLDYPEDVMSESYVSAPLSYACTRGLSTRLESIDISMESASRPAASPSLIASDTSADAPPVSTRQTRGSTSSRSGVSEDVSSITASVATSTRSPTPTPSEPAASALPQGRSAASGPSWHCRSCGKDPCEDPTATQCGHIFCYKCIVKEIAQSMKCPVCNKLFLLRLQAS